MSITKSELIERVITKMGQLSAKDAEAAVKTILEEMAQALALGERIEVRGFGSFCLHFRSARKGRNPKTGEAVELNGKYVPHFKPGKELRDRVNLVMQEEDTYAAAKGGVVSEAGEGLPAELRARLEKEFREADAKELLANQLQDNREMGARL